ncbi:23S rRNA (guanosine(2251)-2'-O)-methyltransferase RlmB [Gammaproteobacteria bacterium]|nr:23S rRNA (guanosine(2251)-2'-O)-methyltransferase RlmB [Gammaproteobacteria bacterium]
MSEKKIVYGLHSVNALLAKQPKLVSSLYISKQRDDASIKLILEIAHANNINIEHHAKKNLDQFSSFENHQGVLAICHKRKSLSEKDLDDILVNLKGPAFFLILDSVQDPHNLGACLRSADAAGVTAVIAPKDNSAGVTKVVSKVACGAAETVPFVQVTNLSRTMEFLKKQNIWLFGADSSADKTIYQSDFTMALGLVLGAEGKGLRRLTKEKCDFLIKIPMNGFVDSLNVSVATGICLFETLRQRINT